MAHLSSEQVEDTVTAAIEFRIPTLIDNVYLSTPTFKILDMEERITSMGGTRIEQPFIFDRPPGGSYRGMDTLNTTRRKTKSLLQLDWKQYYSAVTIDGLTRLKTSGDAAIIDLVDTELQGAELRLKEDLGGDVFLDGTGNDGKALDGFDIAIATTGTYGGITRGVDPEGSAFMGNVDTAGGPFSLPAVQSVWGDCTYGASHPSLLVTTQDIFDSFWARLQPQQRAPLGPKASQLFDAGFSVIMFNGVPVTVDQRCPTGSIYLVNMDFVKLVTHEQRQDIEVEGPLTPTQQDGRVWRLFWAGNLLIQGSRYQGRMTNITA